MADKNKSIILLLSFVTSLLVFLLTAYNTFVIRTFENGIDDNKKDIKLIEEVNRCQDKEIAEVDKKIESHIYWHEGFKNKKLNN